MNARFFGKENFYTFLTENTKFSKILFNQLTLIEYDCPLQQSVVPIWSPHDYVVYVLNGKKTWFTQTGDTITLQKGDTAYIKKGGHFARQHFEDNFCFSFRL
jgi:hypothetical protein